MTAIELLKKRLEEVKQKKQAALEKIHNEYDIEIKDLEITINHVETICQKCKGSGIERYCDAAGDMDDRECERCGGTGKIVYTK